MTAANRSYLMGKSALSGKRIRAQHRLYFSNYVLVYKCEWFNHDSINDVGRFGMLRHESAGCVKGK